ncbi:MAG: hypothetical protein HFH11_12520 [Dorea sp.]|jgi:hypothetical protein|nr:hypothetical protein [Dorea sp.]
MTNEEIKRMIDEGAKKDFMKHATDQLQYVSMLREMGYTAGEAISFMIFLKLEEISDVLYGEGEFGSVAENLSAISDCVGYIPPNHYQKEGYHILRIGGSVDTGNY